MRKFTPVILFYTLILGTTLALSVFLDRTVTVLSLLEAPPGRFTILIDPGHGYPDGGAVSCTGAHECVINLEISQRLSDLFRLLGYDTQMLRTGADSVYTEGETIAQKKVSDLKERLRIIKNTENAVLLSIHQNHYTDGRYRGAQMFYAKTAGSEALAKTLQSAFVTHLNPGSNRKAKPAQGIYLMEHTTIPSVLVECGFLSNPEEEALLRDPSYQKEICCTIITGLWNYLANT